MTGFIGLILVLVVCLMISKGSKKDGAHLSLFFFRENYIFYYGINILGGFSYEE